MKVDGLDFKTVWMEGEIVYMIEQNQLPFRFQIFESHLYSDTCFAIQTMIVRGAGAIGVSAGFAMAQAVIAAPEEGYAEFLQKAKAEIEATRPTAQNLFAAVNKVFEAALLSPERAIDVAHEIAGKDASDNMKIGIYGNELIKDGMRIETHCNAGWLAFTDYGTALSPIYIAHRHNKKVFVWVDETRPRSQGARLTAWELQNEEVPHTIIADNAGAYYMANGKVDIMIVGADRIAANGDTANKIGTLEKAIAAKYYGIPFYIAAPTTTIDMNCPTGAEIPIEFRSADELLYQSGIDADQNMHTIRVAAPMSNAENPAFDVTPAELISGIITEKGIVKPQALHSLFK